MRKGENMQKHREIVGLTEPLIVGGEYWVQWSRESIRGEYVTVEHVNRKGIATVTTIHDGIISGGSRHDIRVSNYVWYTDLI
jgi:hypothetical protein